MQVAANRRNEVQTVATYEIEDPEEVREKTADGQGRVNFGKDYANKRVRVVLEEVIEEDQE